MGLFHRNEKEANFAGGSKNVMESIQRQNDTGTLIYLDPRQDFNANSVITVAPNEQAIFIKNGEFYGTLPSGRHEVKTENYPLLSRIRNMLTGGMSTFTCQVYHVQTNEQKIDWGTSTPIEIQDFFLGGGFIGVPTLIRGAAAFRVRFNINEDDDASKRAFMRLMGDQSTYTVADLGIMFEAEIGQKISSVVGKTLESISMQRSINAISSQLEDFATVLKPRFDEVFVDYGLELVNFSFYNLNIDETDERKKYLDRLIAAAHTGSYDKAVQQELLKDVAVNPGAGGIASAGAGLGMGMAAGNAFAQMATTAFSNPQIQQPPQSQGFGGQGRFGTGGAPQQHPASAQPDPMESLSKMKQMLDAGLIKQEQYDAKVAEIMSRL
ncbi:SPFH domain-containing protein [Prevotellamassilia timonensis]|uniref:SPFH domain-containing protein n=1 Tax=Prevotellamassilia timonensis TaxID=1852370 RepID=UPI004028A524